jgi:predicted  nucleic acid-binding Zn-ribbon protein
VLRAALAEAEERQVEAQMAVLTLETDKTTLESQLQGMRAQKQQLEMMLLFGGATQSGCWLAQRTQTVALSPRSRRHAE